MSQQLAHDLSDNKWRSEDINIANEEESEVTFASLNLSQNILSGLKTNGFVRLSAIQLHAIPLGRCGLDLILQSKSGTGKTCVFVVIALELLESFQSNGIQVVVICPTREIAVQTNQVMSALGQHLPNFKSCAVIGGTKLKDDVNLISKCQAVVATPGRIKQLIDLNLLKTNSIRLLVLDECDKLLDNNFKQQIDAIFECLPQNKQMIAVSATMTTDLANFLGQYMRTPVFVRLNADNPALIGVKQFYRMTEYHHLNHMNFDNKIDPLIEILKNISFSQCLVFSNYQTRARMLCDKLNASDWKTTYISADKCQSERLEALSKLKKYKCRILVSTDLTARGIDVQNINLVINMDTPFDAQTYLHRIGRAGRFGTRGIAITIASSGREEEQLNKIIKECKLKVEELKHPIPKDIWNMDESNEDFNVILNESIEQKQSQEFEDYNPFNCFSDNSMDSSNRLMSFNEILNEYNTMNDTIKSSDYSLQTNDEQKCLNLVNNLEENLSVSQNQSVLNHFNDCILDISQNSVALSNDVVINSQQLDESSVFHESKAIPTFDVLNTNEEKTNYCSSDPKDKHSMHSNPKVCNQWSNALFPHMSSVETPIGYNQWINNNKHLWTYLLDPFQTK